VILKKKKENFITNIIYNFLNIIGIIYLFFITFWNNNNIRILVYRILVDTIINGIPENGDQLGIIVLTIQPYYMVVKFLLQKVT